MSGNLQWRPVAILLLLSLVWGGNMAIIKLTGRDLAPMFQAGLRSLLAAACLLAWMLARRQPILAPPRVVLHGLVAGLLFGGEFALLYIGIERTLASRAVLLLYTSPFFVALGAHFLLKDDRLNTWKVLGLALAFLGVSLLFWGQGGLLNGGDLWGDLLCLMGGALWAATTLYIKRYLSWRAGPVQVLLYQLVFSAPLLLGLSLIWEPVWVMGWTWRTSWCLAYQAVLVAFITYLAWFHLVGRHQVSLLHSFSFFTPVFGVFLSGVLVLGEPLGWRVSAALALVSLGTLMVNRHAGSASAQATKAAPRG